VKIDAETRREIAIESATVDRDMYLLVADAWKAYKEAKLRREPSRTDSELVARLLRLWYEPRGIEIPLRRVIAESIEMPEPQKP
jgi:hypothetical protein